MYRSGPLARVLCRSRSPRVTGRVQQVRNIPCRTLVAVKCQQNNNHLNHNANRFPKICFNLQRSQPYSTDLPEHYLIGLPALSPTMEMGTLVRWTKEEGDSLSEGDLLAEIETDKATMGFETPEEGFLAKILVGAGTKDVPLGKLLCIIVTEKEDIAKFQNYEPSADAAGSGSPAAATTPAQPTSPPEEVIPAAPAKSYPSHITVNLPALSPTMERGSLQSWLKSEGDELAEGDVIAQIETDKATMDFETPDEGFLAKILVPAGAKDIPLGQLLCIITETKEDIAAFADYTPPTEAAPKPAAPTPPTPAPAAPTPAPTPSPTPSGPQVVPAPPRKAGERIFASPYARKLAADKGYDLSLIQASGPEGRIIARDVESYVPSAAPPPGVGVPVPAPGASYSDIPLTGMRKVIAQRLTESKSTIPHYYLSVDITMDNIVKLRHQLNGLLAKENVKLSVNDFILKAAAAACKKVPEANSSWQETYIRQYNTVDICVAVATDEGLITPIVTQVERKGLATISQTVQDLALRAREKKLQPHEFQGGSFTISNLGMFGIKHFTAVINPPQACILAVGGATKQLIVDENSADGYREASVLTVTLSCDHRVVDGAVGARWLQHFKAVMETPESLLL